MPNWMPFSAPMPTEFQKPLEVSRGKKFADMSGAQKFVFLAKLLTCIVTFGFVFPNVQND